MNTIQRSGYLMAFAVAALSVVLTGCSSVKYSGASHPVEVNVSLKEPGKSQGYNNASAQGRKKGRGLSKDTH